MAAVMADKAGQVPAREGVTQLGHEGSFEQLNLVFKSLPTLALRPLINSVCTQCTVKA